MSYLSFYRKWRPNNLLEIRGQEPIVKTLTHALEQGRIAHAYLFAGPRGTGKTSIAKILAKCLNCELGITVNPCDKCESCRKIKSGYAMDVLEIDAASNRGIDEIRDLREKVKFLPSEGRYKVYIIDEVHMLTTEAFNALLKTLEEPPEHVVFILATTELHKIPATILSRCQCFDFKPIILADIIGALRDIAAKEGITVEEEALYLLARNAEGGMRDALGLLDQSAAFANNQITTDDIIALLGLTDAKYVLAFSTLLQEQDEAGVLLFIEQLCSEGRDLYQFVKGALGHFRNLLFYKIAADPTAILPLTAEERKQVQEQSLKFRKQEIQRIIALLLTCEAEMKRSFDARWMLEFHILQLFAGQDRLSVLEKKLAEWETRLADGQIPLKKEKVAEKEKIVQEKIVVAEKEELAPSIPTKVEPKGEPVQTTVSLEEMEEIWPLLLEKVKKKKRTYHAYLLEGSLSAVRGNQIILTFPKKFLFHKENAERPEVKTLVQEILATDFQKECTLQCLLQETSEQKEKIIPSEKKADALLEQTLQFFEGEIIESKEE